MVKNICLIFEVHQPYRLSGAFYSTENWDTLLNLFDSELDREVFLRALKKCYLPASRIILDVVRRYKRENKEIGISFSFSGVFLEQAEKWGKEFLSIVEELVSLKAVELLCQTYYHSLASLFRDLEEFKAQVEMHRKTIEERFGVKPITFENTELIYNDKIGRTVYDLGFKTIIAEGVKKILGWRSPNYVYKAKGCNLRILLRHYMLSDDIAFRFSSRTWDKYPLTADKYLDWIQMCEGQYTLIFVDFETFGEHHYPETGIHEFLRHLLLIGIKRNLNFVKPSEIIEKFQPVGEFSVPEYNTISWADEEKDTSAWLNNQFQVMAFKKLEDLKELLYALGDNELLKMWRTLQISDHLYYMSSKGGGAGVVHDYFSPFKEPLRAYNTFICILLGLEREAKRRLFKSERAYKYVTRNVGEKGFRFFKSWSEPLDIVARSLPEFLENLKTVPIESIRYHQGRGDFFRWIDSVVGDHALAKKTRSVEPSDPRIRRKLIRLIERRLNKLAKLRRRRMTVS